MSLKSKLAQKLGVSNINAVFKTLYNVSFILQGLFDSNNERRKVLFKVKDYTHVNYKRLKFLWNVAERIGKSDMKGAFVETGVWKGGCAGILAHISKKYNYKNPLFFFDSFEGLPEPTIKDGVDAIRFAGGKNTGKLSPIERVSVDETFIKYLLFNELEIKKSEVQIIKGWFQNTLKKYKTRIETIALLRLDGDWYESTKIPLEELYDLVVSGGYIVIDDYYYWDGCKKAVDEFIEKNKLRVDIKKQDVSGAYFVKP